MNRQRFEQNARELEATLLLVRKAAAGETLTSDQGRGLVDVVARYTQTFLLLQRYDEGLLTEPKGAAGGALLPLVDAQTDVQSNHCTIRLPRESGDPEALNYSWVPAFAGTTKTNHSEIC